MPTSSLSAAAVEPCSFGCGCVIRHWRSAGFLLALTDGGNACGDPAALELDGDGAARRQKVVLIIKSQTGRRRFDNHPRGKSDLVSLVHKSSLFIRGGVIVPHEKRICLAAMLIDTSGHQGG